MRKHYDNIDEVNAIHTVNVWKMRHKEILSTTDQ